MQGRTFVISPKYEQIEGFACTATLAELPSAPDLAFVGVARRAAVEVVTELRDLGCKSVICNAAGFLETGDDELQGALSAAAGNMALLGPNSIGLVNFLDPMAAVMDHFGCAHPASGVAIVSQGGGFLCDCVFADRGLPVTHLVGCGNQAGVSVAEATEFLLDDPRVTAVGLSFEGTEDVDGLRCAAARAATLGKPIVALKFGRSEVGARAAASHTASMTGAGAAWDALFDRLGIIATATMSEFLETLKLVDSGHIPNGRRALVTAASGVMGIMLADHLSAAGFELPQPPDEISTRMRPLLPDIATPANPMDVTMAAWNDTERQVAFQSVLLETGYDLAILVQNYPPEGAWDVSEYAAQLVALADAATGRDMALIQLAPLIDCLPDAAREQTRAAGMVPMQGLAECIAALGHVVRWQERLEAIRADGSETLNVPRARVHTLRALNEAEAKARLAAAGIPVPKGRACDPVEAADIAGALGFPVAVKALDATLLHKSEVGGVALGLNNRTEVAEAVARMQDSLRTDRVLIEHMAPASVAEVMASVTTDLAVGRVMVIAGGGVQAELWSDQRLIAAPFTRQQIETALASLKTSTLIAGYRGQPAGDATSLVDALVAIAELAESSGAEIEVNPFLIHTQGVTAVDAVMQLP